MSVLIDYEKLNTREDKRLFCISLDINDNYKKQLSYKKLSLFSINVYFEKITGMKPKQNTITRTRNFKEHKTY